MSFRASQKRGEQLSGKLQMRVEVDSEYAVPVFFGHLDSLTVVGDAGIVHQDVDTAPFGEDFGDGGRYVAGLARSSQRRLMTSTPLIRASAARLAKPVASMSTRNNCVPSPPAEGDRPSDSRGRAGDECRFPTKLTHHLIRMVMKRAGESLAGPRSIA